MQSQHSNLVIVVILAEAVSPTIVGKSVSLPTIVIIAAAGTVAS